MALVTMLACCPPLQVAVSDHRGSVPTPHALAALASEARVGGMLGGKAGLVHCHMGPGAALLDPLWAALQTSNGDIPISQVGLRCAVLRSAVLPLCYGTPRTAADS